MNREHLMGFAPAAETSAMADDPSHAYIPSRWLAPAVYPLGIPTRLRDEFDKCAGLSAEVAKLIAFEEQNHKLPDGSMQPTPRQIEDAMRAMLRAQTASKRAKKEAAAEQSVIADLSNQLAEALRRVRELEFEQGEAKAARRGLAEAMVASKAETACIAGDLVSLRNSSAQPLTIRADTTTYVGMGQLVGAAGVGSASPLGAAYLAQQQGGAALKA